MTYRICFEVLPGILYIIHIDILINLINEKIVEDPLEMYGSIKPSIERDIFDIVYNVQYKTTDFFGIVIDSFSALQSQNITDRFTKEKFMLLMQLFEKLRYLLRQAYHESNRLYNNITSEDQSTYNNNNNKQKSNADRTISDTINECINSVRHSVYNNKGMGPNVNQYE